jgi:hypothetical protein
VTELANKHGQMGLAMTEVGKTTEHLVRVNSFTSTAMFTKATG